VNRKDSLPNHLRMTALALLLLCSAASVQAFLAQTTVLAGTHLQQQSHQHAIATFTRYQFFSAGGSCVHSVDVSFSKGANVWCLVLLSQAGPRLYLCAHPAPCTCSPSWCSATHPTQLHGSFRREGWRHRRRASAQQCAPFEQPAEGRCG
jgi:hypothetical protein